MNVRTIFSTDAKGQSSAYRIGFAKALEDGYPYCITVDGNNKDSVEQIPEFLRTLQEGFDFVQGSRLKTLVWIFSKPGSYNGIWRHVFHV